MSKEKKKARQLGSIDDTQHSGWLLCTVVDVHLNTYTCDVVTQPVAGGSKQYVAGLAWPTAYRDPSNMGGEVSVPKRGQQFALHRELGSNQLSLAVPPAQLIHEPAAEHRIFHKGEAVGGTDPVYASGGARNYRGGLPADVLPGDWVRIGTKGNLVGVLEGGVSVLKATELAKVIANSTGDLLQLVGRNMDIISDFGEIQFRNNDGKVSMSLRGGSQQTTEASPSQERFTIHLDLGHSGELADFRITDPQGHVVAQVHYHPDGSVTSISTNEDKTIRGAYAVDVVKSVTWEVGGDHTVSTRAGNITGSAGGTHTTVGADGVNIISGNDTSVLANRDMTLRGGRGLHLSAGGSLGAKKGDAACTTVITNGSWVVDIGNPAAGDLGAALSGFSLRTQGGNIELQSQLGRIALRTTAPNTVQLGGMSPTAHAVLYERLEAFMDVIGAALDTHTHGHPLGPTLAPTVPLYKTTKPLLEAARSLLVTLGG